MLTLLGQQLFPLDNAWNQNISTAPVASNSSAIIANIGASTRVTPNWSADNPADGNSPLYGIPFNVVHGNSAAKVNVIIDNYPGESDIVPVPVPPNAVLEGDYQDGPNPNGAGYNPNQRGDSHLIVWDDDNNIAYELYGVSRPSDPTLFPNTSNVELPHTDGMWHAAQETVWNMNTDTFRTLGETSADAAGLSILAGLARPDEALPVSQGGHGAIDHALGVTLPYGDINPQYIYPASHMISTSQSPDNLPLGARLRLANTPTIDNRIANMRPESQALAVAMQQYGLIVTDVGSSMYISGAPASVDANNNITLTWDLTDIFASNGLEALNAGDFQVVNLTPFVTGLSTSSGAPGGTITINGQNFSGAAGNLSVYFGNTAASSVKVLSDNQLSVVVPSGMGTVDVTVQSGVDETDNLSSNPSANVNAPIFGYGTSAATPADMFTFTAPPSFANLSAPTITYGTATTIIFGQLDSNTTQPVSAGETVLVTLNGVTQKATLDGNDDFSTTFDTSTLAVAGSPYTIKFNYGGDISFPSASAMSTLVVNPASLTLVADNESMNHYDTVPTLTYHYIGFVYGDNASNSGIVASVSLSTTATSTSAAGYYPIEVTVNSFSAPNYVLVGTQASTLNVKPKVMDVRVDVGNTSMSLIGLSRDLPFINIKAIDVLFSDNVNVSSSMLKLLGVNVPTYSFNGFSYNSTTFDATWSLSSAVGIDRLSLSLDGEAAPPVAGTGPNIGADPFSHNFAVLPGDVSGDGVVAANDMVLVRNQILAHTYLVWDDIDGSGVVDINDLNGVRKRVGTQLP
jgi:hypothetical protein